MWDQIKRDIQKPQTLEEVVEGIRRYTRMKYPGPFGFIGSAISKGLAKRYVEMSGDTELDPELSLKELYQYFDSKYGWTAEEEKRKGAGRRLGRPASSQDILTRLGIRTILGTLVQGMPPEGYKEELRKIGWYRAYREELRQFGWNEEQIDAFINDLGGVH